MVAAGIFDRCGAGNLRREIASLLDRPHRVGCPVQRERRDAYGWKDMTDVDLEVQQLDGLHCARAGRQALKFSKLRNRVRVGCPAGYYTFHQGPGPPIFHLLLSDHLWVSVRKKLRVANKRSEQSEV